MTSTTLIEKCCLIAQPVAGNPTHFMVEQAFAQAGLDWRFMSFEIEPERLDDAMRGIRALGFRGVKVAEPYQESVIAFLDDLTDRARACGSVNSITCDGKRLSGDNTEGAALVELVRERTDLAGQRAMIVGAGRLARALSVALAHAGAAEITVASRTRESGQRLVDLIAGETSTAASLVEFGERDSLKIPSDVVVLINATSLSSAKPSAALPLELSSPTSKGVVVDVSYSAPSTWLTRQAAKLGWQGVDGVDLYVRQTALALKAWTGNQPDMSAMRDAAEEFWGCNDRSMTHRGLFITGTGTGVGKTFVAAHVARALRSAGHRVGIYKPVASGCEQHEDRLVSPDAIALWEAAGRPGTLEQICPQRFAAPLAPHLAARMENERVDTRLLRTGLDFWRATSDIVLVEGAGGLMSPVSDDDYNADLAADFGYPLVVVAANELGTINATIQTLIAASTFYKKLEVAGIVLNSPRRLTDDPSVESNAAELMHHCLPPLLAEVPHGGTFDRSVDWWNLR